jgi:hypothetical protein
MSTKEELNYYNYDFFYQSEQPVAEVEAPHVKPHARNKK